MVHLITGYAGYAHIKSEDQGAFNASFFGDGQYVMEFGNQLAGSIIDNNTVRILEGDGLMYGRHFRIEAPEDVTIQNGTAGTNRIDLICMTYEKNSDDGTEKAYLQVIQGAETEGTAVAPEYTDGNILEDALFNQMPLYKVTIEGVVLSEIEPLFATIPSYEGIAKMYSDRFDAICQEFKKTLSSENFIYKEDVVDNLESEKSDNPLSAKQGNVLSGFIGVLTSLKTSLKTSLVDAINELVTSISNKIDKANIVNNATTTSSGYVLDARQGKILNDKLLDYIVEQGTSANGWTYRKWYSGKLEAWKTYSPGALSSNSSIWGGQYYVSAGGTELPYASDASWYFNATPMIIWSGRASNFNGGFYKDSYQTASSTGSFGIMRAGTFSDITPYFDIYAVGTWK